MAKMNTLDSRIAEESNNLKTGIEKMQADMVMFENIDKIKVEYEANKKVKKFQKPSKIYYKTLIASKQIYMKRKELLGQQNQVLSSECDVKEKTLRDDEMHTQLEVLEKSLKHYEQNNFTMKECILLISLTEKFFLDFSRYRLQG